MTSLSRRSNTAVLAAYDFGRFQNLTDVGGGNGAFLAAVLMAHPTLRGVLFDQPHVVSGAHAVLEAAGVTNRCRVISGSFFESLPDNSDGYVLRTVIHDWDDGDAIRILKVVRGAIADDGTVLLIERIVSPPNGGRDAKFADLNMLVGLGGRERTREEYAELLQQSGFALRRITDAGTYSVIEGALA
jgi:hypothetical protein